MKLSRSKLSKLTLNIDINSDNLYVLLNLYPNANDEIIKYAISILEGNLIK